MQTAQNQYENLSSLLESFGDEGLACTARLLRCLPRLDHESGMMAVGILFVIVQIGAELTGMRLGDEDDPDVGCKRLAQLNEALVSSMECLDAICANSAHPPAQAPPSAEA